MKRLLIGLSLMATVCHDARALEWLTDLPSALARAKSEDKSVLLDFTGSDWCGWCQKLKREVFDQPEFATYAEAHLVLVEVDFPRHKELSAEQRRANQGLAARFGIRGYPTIIVLNADGQQIGQSGYRPSARDFINEVDQFSGHTASPEETDAPRTTRTNSSPNVPIQAPAFPTGVRVEARQYDDIRLKGISGAGDRRFALINNETFLIGETGKVKVHGTNVSITLKDIRGTTAVILVNERPLELILEAPGSADR